MAENTKSSFEFEIVAPQKKQVVIDMNGKGSRDMETFENGSPSLFQCKRNVIPETTRSPFTDQLYMRRSPFFMSPINTSRSPFHQDGGHFSQADSSFLHSTINIVGITIGLGQLSTPYALESGGWMSAGLLIGLGMICAYTAVVMGKCMESNPSLRNYQDIGQKAFGKRGRIIITTFLYLEIFLALVSYTISLGDNLATIFLGSHISIPWIHLPTARFVTIIAVLIAIPSLWLKDLSTISFLSSAGILMSILLFFSVAWTAAFGGVGISKSIPALNIAKIPGISGIYIFSYAGHVVFPNIYKAMKNPSSFPKVIAVSFGIITATYTGLAFLGASMFGRDINSQITLNMPRHQVVTQIALWTTVITPMTKYALELAPVAMQVETFLPKSMGSKCRMAVRATFGSLLLIFILVIALTIPYFSYVLALTGSLLSACISIVFPCLFHLKICGSAVSKPLIALNIFLIVFGVFFGIFGTVSSVESLVRTLQKAHA